MNKNIELPEPKRVKPAGAECLSGWEGFNICTDFMRGFSDDCGTLALSANIEFCLGFSAKGITFSFGVCVFDGTHESENLII